MCAQNENSSIEDIEDTADTLRLLHLNYTSRSRNGVIFLPESLKNLSLWVDLKHSSSSSPWVQATGDVINTLK